MGAAQECVSDLVFALEAEDTKRIVKQHRLPDTAPDRNRHVFSVTVMRGEGLLGKGTRAADGFAVVTDKETGERLIKTETVLGVEDPNWWVIPDLTELTPGNKRSRFLSDESRP